MKRIFSAITLALLAATLMGAMLPITAASQENVLPSISLEQLLDMAKVDAPTGDLSLQIHADFPADAPLVLDGVAVYSLTANVVPGGTVQTHNAVTSRNVSEGGPFDACSDPAFAPTGVLWDEADMPVTWWFRRTSTPKYMSRYATTQALRHAHQVWPRQVTDCSDAAPNTFHFSYQGGLSKGVGYDGHNLIDFGDLDGALAVSYTWYQGTRAVEVDMRINKVEFEWTAVEGGSSRYQVANVATHEIGHHLGLDDLAQQHQDLTMFGVIGKGEMKKTTLGRGDMKGAETVSP